MEPPEELSAPTSGGVRRRGWLLPLVGVWVLAGVLLAFFQRPLLDALWIVALGFWPLYAIAGLALLVIAVLRLRARDRRAFAAIVIILGCSVAFWFGEGVIATWGDEWISNRRFARMRPEYERIIREVEHASTAVANRHRVDFVIDSGPPLRVAFPQAGGILDNWEGVVYDPTDVVASAAGWRDGIAGRYTAPPNVRILFGGDLVGCKIIVRPFYRCWFT